uniref:Retrovirus-related Pol polyprotein from transposon TNT 1-94-like beta-barrel domain-containing protein n=1 Tax=Lactuca sativa TaxID=4236 RepID=A0A9R1V9D6_LACSA|nr:hypothetical protein LSAT_V11C600325740 [Lactuca sativa]
MNLHLNTINKDVWKSVEGTYITPKNMAILATNQATQTKIIRKLELQAKKELVSGIPHNILSQMDDIILLTANQIWENLKNRFCGNKRIIGNKRTSILNEFDNFKMLSSETIHDAHDRFNLIMVKMNQKDTTRDKSKGNPAIHTKTLYNLYGELQSYESSIDPPTTIAFGGPLALVSTTSQNQTPFNDQDFNHFNQTTSFQNQAFQSDSNDEADYQQLCALVANTNLQRFLLNHDETFKTDHLLDKITQVFNLNLTLEKSLKDLPSITTQTMVFKTRDFKTIPTHVIIIIQITRFPKLRLQQSKQWVSKQPKFWIPTKPFSAFPTNPTQALERLPVKSQKDKSDEEVIICHNCKGINHYARECRAKNKTKIKDSTYYAQRVDKLKKMENQEKQRALMAIHEPSPISNDEPDNEPAQSNFCFVVSVDIHSIAPNVIEQVCSMISELGFSKTIFESHITKIEKSLEADLKTYRDTMVNYDIYKSELQTLQLKFGESTRTKSKLERDVERKSEDYNHVLEQLNQTLIQKRDLEQKNQSVISSEIKDVLEMEILQLKQDFQESTDKYNILNEKLTDSLKQINSLETENKILIWNMDSIKENMTNCENSESTLPNLFTSVNEEDSDDETVINCSPDDTAFTISKKSFKRVVNSETFSASSLTHRIKHTDGTTKHKNLLNGENSSNEDGSTSVPTAFPTMSSSIAGKTSLGQKYSKKQQTSKKSIQVTKTPLIKPNIFENQPKKPVQPYVIPHKQVLNAGEPNDDTWYIDNGCSKHMTGNRNYLRDFKPTQTSQDVTFGNNMTTKTKGYGNITNSNFTIKKVAFVDDLKHNLISVSRLCDNNLEVLFTKQRSLIMDAKTKDVIVDSDHAGNMYPLDMDLIYGKANICLLSKAPSNIS